MRHRLALVAILLALLCVGRVPTDGQQLFQSGSPTNGHAYDVVLGTGALGHALTFGTLTTSTPFTLSQTWNASGVTFFGEQIAITKTAAANGSRVWSASIGGSEVAYLDGASNPGRFHAANFEGAHLFLTAAGSVVSWPGAEMSSCAGNNNLKLNDNNETIGVGLDFNTANTLTAKTYNCGANGHVAAASVRGIATTVAGLPTGVEGMLVAVTDSTTTQPGATITGGGANHVLAYYNGTAWQVGGAAAPIVQTTTATGTQNDFALTPGASVLRVNNATLTTFTGFAGGVDGQRLEVLSVGAGAVDLSPQDAGSTTAADRLLNLVTVGKTPLAPGVGVARYVYDGTSLRWRLVEHNQGAPITQPYTNTDFTAAAGTWTVDSGDVTQFTYFLQGKQLTVNAALATTSVSQATTELFLIIPHGFNAASGLFAARGGIIANDPGTGGWGTGFIDPSSTTLGFFKTQYGGATTWNVATNTTYVFFTVTFLVQ